VLIAVLKEHTHPKDYVCYALDNAKVAKSINEAVPISNAKSANKILLSMMAIATVHVVQVWVFQS
jgi:hypothetical protein